MFRRNIRSNVFDILLDAFIYNLFPDNCIEEDVKFYYNLLQVIFFVCILFSYEKSILLLQNMLDFTDNM